MTEHDQAHRKEAKSEADQTLLGVAPPRIDSATDTLQRAPVYVRSGTSVADVESAPQSRVPLPSQPPPALPKSALVVAASPALGVAGVGDVLLRIARRRPVLWMVLTPVLVASFALLLGHHGHARAAVAPASSALAPAALEPVASGRVKSPESAPLADSKAKPPDPLSSRELVALAEARSEQKRDAVRALRSKVLATPTLANDSAVQTELLKFASDERTARDALATMAALEPPIGADLLYEIWTGTAQRSETTELARTLVYSTDVRPTASPPLAVALDLRVAETCEAFKAILPKALKDGDRRAVHLLTKLNAKRGCGPKKAADCFACLRESSDELNATISAVKSRRAPSYTAE